MKTGLIALFVACMLTTGCGSSGTTEGTSCSITQIETAMDTSLAQTASEVDFSFSVERQDGRRYTYNRGVSTLQTTYESASTSKLVTAVIILRLVEQGYLSLTDRPQDRIGSWPITSGDSLYQVVEKHPSIYNRTLHSINFPALSPVSGSGAIPVLAFKVCIGVRVTRLRYSVPGYFAFA